MGPSIKPGAVITVKGEMRLDGHVVPVKDQPLTAAELHALVRANEGILFISTEERMIHTEWEIDIYQVNGFKEIMYKLEQQHSVGYTWSQKRPLASGPIGPPTVL